MPWKPKGFDRISLAGGWTNPFEKYVQVKLDRISPIFGVKMKKIYFKPPPSSQ